MSSDNVGAPVKIDHFWTSSAVLQQVDASQQPKLAAISEFLIAHPDLAKQPRKGDEFASQKYWEEIATQFVRGRAPRAPVQPVTVPDPMVSVILDEYFDMEPELLPVVGEQHRLSMAAENIVGDLLERYIASQLEPHDWVWCSGSVVKKVDFLGVKSGHASKWTALQIKNRDNSENSSSSSVRDGTQIEKWFRTFSRTGKTNWENFPKVGVHAALSEEAFQDFARAYLREIKA